jgi:sec-independent protein translocase protein TatB
MSGVGFWEVILLFLIGLVVLGPERLPRVAQQLGTWLGQARRMTRMMRRQLEDELNLEQELSIRPRSRPLPPPGRATRAVDDDTYSPAHDTSAAGTGIEPAAAGSANDQPETETPGTEESEKPADPAAQEKNP